MDLKIKPLPPTITSRVDITDEQIKLFEANEDFNRLVFERVREAMLLNIEPFMDYYIEDDRATCSRSVYGKVRLCRVGKWEPIEREPHRHKCSICQTAADDDGHVGEIITPFCPYCGAYLTNAGDIVAKRSEATT